MWFFLAENSTIIEREIATVTETTMSGGRGLIERIMFPGVKTYTIEDIPSPPLEFVAGVPCLHMEPLNGHRVDHRVILFCHGNSSDLGSVWRAMGDLATKLNAHIFAMEYRGYGIHVGTATPQNAVVDARRVMRELHRRYRWAVHLIGYSIGTGVVSATAAQETELTASVTLLAPFYTMHAVVVGILGGVTPLVYRQEGDYFNSSGWLAQLPPPGVVRIPILIIHGDQDSVIPVEHGRRLRSELTGAAYLELKGVGHQINLFDDRVVGAIMTTIDRGKMY